MTVLSSGYWLHYKPRGGFDSWSQKSRDKCFSGFHQLYHARVIFLIQGVVARRQRWTYQAQRQDRKFSNFHKNTIRRSGACSQNSKRQRLRRRRQRLLVTYKRCQGRRKRQRNLDTEFDIRERVYYC